MREPECKTIHFSTNKLSNCVGPPAHRWAWGFSCCTKLPAIPRCNKYSDNELFQGGKKGAVSNLLCCLFKSSSSKDKICFLSVWPIFSVACSQFPVGQFITGDNSISALLWPGIGITFPDTIGTRCGSAVVTWFCCLEIDEALGWCQD